MKLIIATTALLLISLPAWPQALVVTTPVAGTTAGTNNGSTTIGTGGTTFQLVFAAGTPANHRNGCTITNNGTHNMYVTEGIGAANSTTAKAYLLPAGQPYYCNAYGVVLIGELDITGTSGDSFYAAQY